MRCELRPGQTFSPSLSPGNGTNGTSGGNSARDDLDALGRDGVDVEEKLEADHDLGWIIIGLVLLCLVLICACFCSRSCGDRHDEAVYAQLDSRGGQFHTNQVYEHASSGPARKGVEVNPSYEYAGSGPTANPSPSYA